MRILLVTQYFHPENFKSSELAFELAKRGHHVDALVGIPNYPEGKYYKGYGVFKKRREVLNGVNLYRTFQTPRGRKASPIGLSLNYLTFAFFATLKVLFYFCWKKKYDAIIVYEPSPITQMIPGIILGKIRKTQVLSWVTDIWPDSVVSTIGEGKSKYIKPLLNSLTNWVYRNSDKILISSQGMKDLVNRDYDYSEKIIYYPHWCDDILSYPIHEVEGIPSGYNIMMAGNLADGIGVPDIFNLIRELEDVKDLNFIFVGGGAKELEMKTFIQENNLKNVYMLGRHPFNMMASFYSRADAMLLTLKNTNLPHLDVTLPSRLQSYLSAGKPILAMIGSGAASIIREADCGYVVPAGNYKDLADLIRNQVLKHKSEFAEKGLNSRSFFVRNYTLKQCIDNLENIIAKS